MIKVSDSLRQSADVFEERGRVYGEAYKRFGPVMEALFPGGFYAFGPDAFNRLGVIVQIVSKLVRYTGTMKDGGHDDSLLDLSTYAAMLRELDAEGRRHPLARGIGGLMDRGDALSKEDIDEMPPGLSKEDIDAIQESIRTGAAKVEPHAQESVVPRGAGFRVGEIEPRPEDEALKGLRRDLGLPPMPSYPGSLKEFS